jgi:hypothetical protein
VNTAFSQRLKALARFLADALMEEKGGARKIFLPLQIVYTRFALLGLSLGPVGFAMVSFVQVRPASGAM